MAEANDDTDHLGFQSSATFSPHSLVDMVQPLHLDQQSADLKTVCFGDYSEGCRVNSNGEVGENISDVVNGSNEEEAEGYLNKSKIEFSAEDDGDGLKFEGVRDAGKCNGEDDGDSLKSEGAKDVGIAGWEAGKKVENDWGGEDVVGRVSRWADEEEEKGKELVYPLRPGKVDCAFYMRNGHCAYGLNCKFNHPPRTLMSNQVMQRESVVATDISQERGPEEFLRKSGQIKCKYYLMPGGCKYGDLCKYEHCVQEKIKAQPTRLNSLGLPIRPGIKDCTYYMQTSACKYSANCCFNHPDPVAMTGQNYVSEHRDETYLQQNSLMVPMSPSNPEQQCTFVVSSSLSSSSDENPSSSVPLSNTLPCSVSRMLSPSRAANLSSAPKEYQAPASLHFPTCTKTEQTPDVSADGAMTIADCAPSQVQVDFPERPGQPECPIFMNTGICEFRSLCKFHHPRNHPLKAHTSHHCLPLRPDQPICPSYSRFTICKHGPACKFDHPLDSNPSRASTGAARTYREIVDTRALQMEG